MLVTSPPKNIDSKYAYNLLSQKHLDSGVYLMDEKCVFPDWWEENSDRFEENAFGISAWSMQKAIDSLDFESVNRRIQSFELDWPKSLSPFKHSATEDERLFPGPNSLVKLFWKNISETGQVPDPDIDFWPYFLKHNSKSVSYHIDFEQAVRDPETSSLSFSHPSNILYASSSIAQAVIAIRRNVERANPHWRVWDIEELRSCAIKGLELRVKRACTALCRETLAMCRLTQPCGPFGGVPIFYSLLSDMIGKVDFYALSPNKSMGLVACGIYLVSPQSSSRAVKKASKMPPTLLEAVDERLPLVANVEMGSNKVFLPVDSDLEILMGALWGQEECIRKVKERADTYLK